MHEAEAVEFAKLCTTIKDALGADIEKVIVSNCTQYYGLTKAFRSVQRGFEVLVDKPVG